MGCACSDLAASIRRNSALGATLTPVGACRAPKPSVRTFAFADFASALAFVVRLGCHAEKRDHHPDVELGWGRASVRWSTHDAGGITSLDLELAELSDSLVG